MIVFRKVLFYTLIVLCHNLYACYSITLTIRQLCDLELILNDGFAPLKGFMSKADYDNVVGNLRLADGTVWPIPIVLDVNEKMEKQCTYGSVVDLCDSEGTILAKLTVSDVWKPDKEREADCVFGSTDTDHPGVAYLFEKTKDYYVGGEVKKGALPIHYDFADIRHTPAQLKSFFKEKGITKIVAFQTRNPMHRAHKETSFQKTSQGGIQRNCRPASCRFWLRKRL